MPYTGDKYVGDLALYYIAKKLESGQKSGSVKNAVDDVDIDSQLRGSEPPEKQGLRQPVTQFNQDEISAAMNIADNLLNLPDKIKTDDAQKTLLEMERNTEEIKKVEKVVELREQYYTLLQKQLELLWKDMRDGKVPGKDGEFYKAIAEVRKTFPHPAWKDEIMNYDFSKETFEEDLD